MAVQVQLNHLRTSNWMKYGKQQTPSFFTINIQRFGTTLRANAVSGKAQAQHLLQSGTVRSVLPKDAASLLESEGYTLLDVRPEWEREKARVSGSVHVPLFIEDKDNSPLTLLKKWVHFGYIGLWTGQKFTMINPEFLEQVGNRFPDKEAKVLLACGEGLRSVMAVSKLHQGGYQNLGWLVGGFNRAGDKDFSAVEGSEKLKFATIGGASYYFLKLLLLLQGEGKEG